MKGKEEGNGKGKEGSKGKSQPGDIRGLEPPSLHML